MTGSPVRLVQSRDASNDNPALPKEARVEFVADGPLSNFERLAVVMGAVRGGRDHQIISKTRFRFSSLFIFTIT